MHRHSVQPSNQQQDQIAVQQYWPNYPQTLFHTQSPVHIHHSHTLTLTHTHTHSHTHTHTHTHTRSQPVCLSVCRPGRQQQPCGPGPEASRLWAPHIHPVQTSGLRNGRKGGIWAPRQNELPGPPGGGCKTSCPIAAGGNC